MLSARVAQRESVSAPHNFVAPSPQKRPVLWQAGSSEQGREFASKHAESVFGIFPTPKSMRSYADDIRTRADNYSRDPESVKLIYGLQTISAWGMGQQKYAPQEYALGAVLAPDPDSVSDRKALERRIAATFSTERQIAHYLDDLNLPESSVITDTVYGFAILAASQHPKTFVVPSDPDFTELLNSPTEFGIKYLLAVPPTGVEPPMH